jgi:Mg2+/Co2+ transporter CorB
MIVVALGLVFLLGLSAIFAGSETALFTVLRDRELMAKERRERGDGSSVLTILAHPSHLLMTVLLGNLLVNLVFFAMSTIFVMEIEDLYGASAGVLSGFVFLMLVIIFGEIVPKTLAGVLPLPFSRKTAWGMVQVMRTLKPLVHLLEKVMVGLNRLLGVNRVDEEKLSSEHLQDLVGVSERDGFFTGMQGEVMVAIMSLHQLRLKEIRTPRVDVLSCPRDMPICEVIAQGKAWGATLIPLYDEHHDDAEMYIDMVRLMGRESDRAPVAPWAYKMPVFSEMSRMDLVLRAFLENEHRLALVVDEYGEMSGIVTWNDVMKCMRRRVSGDRRAMKAVSGRTRVRDLDGFWDVEVGESVTLAGLIMEHLDRIPKLGEEVEILGTHLMVSKATDRSIEEVLLIQPQEGGGS